MLQISLPTHTFQAQTDLAEEVRELRLRVAELEENLARQSHGPVEKQADDRLTLLFENAPVGITVIRNGRYLHVNPAYIRMYGFSCKQELLGSPIDERIAPECREMLLDLNRTREEGGAIPVQYEIKGRRKDGSIFPVLSSGIHIDLPDGPASLVFVTDISERKAAELRLSETLDFNQKIINDTQVGILAYRLDGSCLLANQAIARIVNATTGQLLSQNIYTLDSWKRSGMLEMAIACLEQNSPQSGEVHFVTTFGREVWLECTFTPFSNNGELHILLTAVDITGRRLVEAALAANEKRFRLLAENARDVIYRVRVWPEWKFEYVSPAVTEITGYTPEELYADPTLFLNLIHPEDRASLARSGSAAMPFSEKPITVRWVRKDGRVIWTEQSNVPIFEESGQLVAVEGIARDITERKQTEEKLTYLSSHDALTGLLNRAYFNDALERLEKEPGKPVTVVMIDVDRMKESNDILGHAVGDELLRHVARVLRSVFREKDIVARIGGDEFAVMLPGVPASASEDLRKRMQSAVQEENRRGALPNLSISFGLATSGGELSLGQALQQADQEMYQMKAGAKRVR